MYGYTEQSDAAIEAMLGFFQRRHGLTVTAEQQLMLPCVVSGMRASVLALTEPGDKVIVQSPVYGPFYASIRDGGRQLADCPLIRQPDGGYRMDLDAIESACRAGAKVMLLCNPHNPVGYAWSEDELRALWNVLERYGVWLVSDEIHEDFELKGKVTPFLRIVQDKNARLLSMTSASKTFNLAGLQQAVLLTRNQELKKRVEEQMHSTGVTQGNIFAMTATEVAYGQCDPWLDGMLDYLREAENLLRRELNARLPEAVLAPMNATYLGWLDLRAYGFTTAQLTERTHKAGVAFSEGTRFGGEAGEGFLRFNFACPHSQTLEAVKRLEKALKA
ncbi:MAG: MalY/PatB family protein [Lachnospiraceae bacterium]